MSRPALTGKQRAALRRAAQAESAVFQLGKEGIGETLERAVRDCLAARELVKLKVLETSPVTAREAADALAEALGAEVVTVIGRTLVLYRQKPNAEESKYAALLRALRPAKKPK